MTKLVFNNKNGVLGRSRLASKEEEKEHHCNYVIDLLDPVTFETIDTIPSGGREWIELSNDDSRVQFVKAFNVIYSADWEINGGCTNEQCDGYDIHIDENYISNEHEVFEQLRKIFNPQT